MMVCVIAIALLVSFACGGIVGYILGYDCGFEVGTKFDDYDCGYHVGYTDAKNKYATKDK